MATPHHQPPTNPISPGPPQPPTSTSTSSASTSTPQQQQPPVELDSNPITAHSPRRRPHPHQQPHPQQESSSTDNDGDGGRRPSVYADPESMAKLRAERSGDLAVVDDPAANEPAAEDFAVAAGLEGGRVGRG